MQTQIGPYQILQSLGAGGMGTVHLARHLGTSEECALKILPPHLMHSPSRLTRFKREMDIALQFDHRHIVSVLDAGVDGDTQFLAMEYLPLGSLERELRESLLLRRSFSVAQAVEIARQIALALDYAHKRGVIHRDVTPGNILCASRGIVDTDRGQTKTQPDKAGDSGSATTTWHYKLGDFGLALQDGTTRLSLAGGIGTLDYISPESILPDAQVDARSDIYSLGVVLYEMLTGRPLFTAEHPLAKLNKLVHEAHVPAAQIRAEVPSALNALLERCLAKHPARRFQSAGELAEALRKFQAQPVRRGLVKLGDFFARVIPRIPPKRRSSTASAPSLSSRRRWKIQRAALPVCLCVAVGLGYAGAQKSSFIADMVKYLQRLTTTMPVYASMQSLPSASPGLNHFQKVDQAHKPDRNAQTVASPSPTSLLAQPTHVSRVVLSAKAIGNDPVLARRRPGLDSAIVGSVNPLQSQEIVGRSVDGQWWLIALEGDATGWVSVAMLQTQGNESAVPVIPATSSP